jgi:transcriptional regulator NrdR family protein
MPCLHQQTKVLETRHSPPGDKFAVIRRRFCIHCGNTIFTREIVDNNAGSDILYFYKMRYFPPSKPPVVR